MPASRRVSISRSLQWSLRKQAPRISPSLAALSVRSTALRDRPQHRTPSGQLPRLGRRSTGISSIAATLFAEVRAELVRGAMSARPPNVLCVKERFQIGTGTAEKVVRMARARLSVAGFRSTRGVRSIWYHGTAPSAEPAGSRGAKLTVSEEKPPCEPASCASAAATPLTLSICPGTGRSAEAVATESIAALVGKVVSPSRGAPPPGIAESNGDRGGVAPNDVQDCARLPPSRSVDVQAGLVCSVAEPRVEPPSEMSEFYDSCELALSPGVGHVQPLVATSACNSQSSASQPRLSLVLGGAPAALEAVIGAARLLVAPATPTTKETASGNSLGQLQLRRRRRFACRRPTIHSGSSGSSQAALSGGGRTPDGCQPTLPPAASMALAPFTPWSPAQSTQPLLPDTELDSVCSTVLLSPGSIVGFPPSPVPALDLLGPRSSTSSSRTRASAMSDTATTDHILDDSVGEASKCETSMAPPTPVLAATTSDTALTSTQLLEISSVASSSCTASRELACPSPQPELTLRQMLLGPTSSACSHRIFSTLSAYPPVSPLALMLPRARCRPTRVSLLGDHRLPGWSARLISFCGPSPVLARPLACTCKRAACCLFRDARQVSAELRQVATALSCALTWGCEEEADLNRILCPTGVLRALSPLQLARTSDPTPPTAVFEGGVAITAGEMQGVPPEIVVANAVEPSQAVTHAAVERLERARTQRVDRLLTNLAARAGSLSERLAARRRRFLGM